MIMVFKNFVRLLPQKLWELFPCQLQILLYFIIGQILNWIKSIYIKRWYWKEFCANRIVCNIYNLISKMYRLESGKIVKGFKMKERRRVALIWMLNHQNNLISMQSNLLILISIETHWNILWSWNEYNKFNVYLSQI